jgi:hypothetical protein
MGDLDLESKVFSRPATRAQSKVNKNFVSAGLHTQKGIHG